MYSMFDDYCMSFGVQSIERPVVYLGDVSSTSLCVYWSHGSLSKSFVQNYLIQINGESAGKVSFDESTYARLCAAHGN